MARVTVEDCLENVENRFQLVRIAAKRARQLSNGADTQLDWENDKPTVVALREIAEGLVNADILRARKEQPVSVPMYELPEEEHIVVSTALDEDE